MFDPLACPVCFQIPEAEVHQCHQGHCLCGECWSQLADRRCPLCRDALPPVNRNRAREQVIAALPAACAHCGAASTRGAVRAHERACASRENTHAREAPAPKRARYTKPHWLQHLEKYTWKRDSGDFLTVTAHDEWEKSHVKASVSLVGSGEEEGKITESVTKHDKVLYIVGGGDKYELLHERCNDETAWWKIVKKGKSTPEEVKWTAYHEGTSRPLTDSAG